MFLSKIDYLGIGTTQIAGELMNKEHGEVIVLADEIFNNFHGNYAYYRRFESSSRRDIWFACEVCTIPEILNRTIQSENLHPVTDAAFV